MQPTVIIGIIVVLICISISIGIGVYFSQKDTNSSGLNTSSTSSISSGSNTSSVTVLKEPVCDKTACNNIMKDWIVNKYWAFGDTANSFGECKKCESRWFKSPFQISKDGNTWTQNSSKDTAYDAVAL